MTYEIDVSPDFGDDYDEEPVEGEPDWLAEDRRASVDALTRNGHGVPAANGQAPAADPRMYQAVVEELGATGDRAITLAFELAQRYAYEQVTGLARRLVRDEQMLRDADFDSIDAVLGHDLLTRERPPRRRIFGDLLLEGHNATVVARYKAGKSTLGENMVEAATTGGRLFGRFQVDEPLRVTYFNYELDEEDMDLRVRRIGLDDDALARLLVVNLRGRRLPLMTPTGRDWCARRLADHGTDLWIMDPFGAAYASAGGQSENDNAEERRFFTAVDEIKRLAGIRTLVMPVHTGRAEQEEGDERARGGTVIDDWPDVQMFLTKDKNGDRFLRTDGRAPFKLDESRLGYDERTGRLMLATTDMGMNRRRARAHQRMLTVADVVRDQPGLNKRDLRDAIGQAGIGNNDDKDNSIAAAKADRLIHVHVHRKDGHLHYAGPPHDGQDCPQGWKEPD